MSSDVVIQLPGIVSEFSFGGRLHWCDGRMVTCIVALLGSLDAIAENFSDFLAPLGAVLLLSKGSPKTNQMHKLLKIMPQDQSMPADINPHSTLSPCLITWVCTKFYGMCF